MIRVLIKLCLLFILVYGGVALGYGELEKRLLPSPATAPEQAAVPETTGKPVLAVLKGNDYKVIVGRNIFEAVPEQKKIEPTKEEPVSKVVEKPPEETKLKLVLHGTVSADSEEDSRAIIVDQKEKRQDLYQVGDAVQGALIVSIERGKVVLELNGKKQFLMLKDREGVGRGSSSPAGRYSAQPKKSAFVLKPSKTAFSRNNRKSPPAAVPHRRISFRQNNAQDVEEPEVPLVEEDLEPKNPEVLDAGE